MGSGVDSREQMLREKGKQAGMTISIGMDKDSKCCKEEPKKR